MTWVIAVLFLALVTSVSFSDEFKISKSLTKGQGVPVFYFTPNADDEKSIDGTLLLDYQNLRKVDVTVEGKTIMSLWNPNHPDAPSARFNGVPATMSGVTSKGNGASIILK